MDASVVLAAVGELDLEHTFGFALLLQERVDHGSTIATDVVDPVSVDQLFEDELLAAAVKCLERCARFAYRLAWRRERAPGEAIVGGVLAGEVRQRDHKLEEDHGADEQAATPAMSGARLRRRGFRLDGPHAINIGG